MLFYACSIYTCIYLIIFSDYEIDFPLNIHQYIQLSTTYTLFYTIL